MATVLKTVAVVALAAYFYWVVITALIRGKTPDFGDGIHRSEQPATYWFQVVLYFLMAAGATIYAIILVDELLKS